MPRFRRRKKIKGLPQDQVDKVLQSEKVRQAVMDKSIAVREYWRSISPVFDRGDRAKEHRKMPPHGAPGDYQRSVELTFYKNSDGVVVGHVAPTDFKKRWIEFGTAHMPEYAPMAKTKAHFRK